MTIQAVADAEGAEAEFMYALEAGAPGSVHRELGMVAERLAGGVVLSMRHDPAGGYWNKALGFGISEPVTSELIDEIQRIYKANQSPVACLQLAPSVLPPDWDAIRARHGIVASGAWVKLLRDPTPAAAASTDLRVSRVTPEHAQTWGEVFCAGFGMPGGALSRMVAAAVDKPAFQAFGAWDADQLVAVANLHLKDGRAAFCGAATLEPARGRGAQTAFMAVRIEAARAAGARVLSAETWAERPGQHNPSLHNMRRVGFVDQYERRNWVWRP